MFTENKMKLRKLLESESISKYVEMVSTDVINKYRTQNKSKWRPELEKSIEAEGITEPLMLIYFVHDNELGLYDGHYRLDIAKDIGLDKVPAYIKLSGSDSPPSAKRSPKVPVWKGKDYLKPSELGLK